MLQIDPLLFILWCMVIIFSIVVLLLLWTIYLPILFFFFILLFNIINFLYFISFCFCALIQLFWFSFNFVFMYHIRFLFILCDRNFLLINSLVSFIVIRWLMLNSFILIVNKLLLILLFVFSFAIGFSFFTFFMSNRLWLLNSFIILIIKLLDFILLFLSYATIQIILLLLNIVCLINFYNFTRKSFRLILFVIRFNMTLLLSLSKMLLFVRDIVF